jgi:hypothetical protein
MATVSANPPFPLDGKAWKPWREDALARIGEQRFVLDWIKSRATVDAEAERTIKGHWEAAADAAKRRSRRGAAVERVTSNLDAVETDLLRLAPPCYVYAQLPGLLAQIKPQLPADDPRVKRIETLIGPPHTRALTPFEHDLIVAAHHDARALTRQQVTRLRSFKNLLFGAASMLAIGALALAAFGLFLPDKLPICFAPDTNIVCATSTNPIPPELIPSGAPSAPGQPTATAEGQPAPSVPSDVADKQMRHDAGPWDTVLLEGVGLLAAGVAGAASLRGIRGTSTPYSVPVAAAVLKLPTGALTAVLGLLLMRGGFVPGLSALDTSGQIIAWAILLGYSQQLLTRFVDRHAQTVLDGVGRRDPADEEESASARAPAAAM